MMKAFRLAAPSGLVGKALAVVWLTACFALLAFGFVQREVHDMAEAFLWLLIVLTFPAGALAAVVVGVGTGLLTMTMGTPYHAFWDELPVWAAGVVVGYGQWFVFLPKQFRGNNSRSQRDA
jgi:hypothetical protein